MKKYIQKLINASELLGWTIRGSNSSRSKRFVSSSELPDRSEAHPTLLIPIQWLLGFFPGRNAVAP
jgi:hypothetical protein